MRQRSHDRQSVHHLRDSRKMVADQRARHASGNRPQLALDFGRGFRLWIKSLMLRGRPVLVDQDARFGLSKPAHHRMFLRLCLAGFQEVLKRKAESAETPDVQEVAAAEPVAKYLPISEERKHQLPTCTSRSDVEVLVRRRPARRCRYLTA